VTEDDLTRYSPWTGKAVLRWADVERVRYSAANRWFVVQGTSATIRVSRHLAGVRDFIDLVKRKLAPERWINAAQAFETVK
jgi:hypothetical protein